LRLRRTEAVIASEAKQSRSRWALHGLWIAASAFGLLAMTISFEHNVLCIAATGFE
jgi:hypothetical protein